MSKKPVDISFEQDDFLLNYRPQIGFVEPEQEILDTVPEPKVVSIDDTKNKTTELVNGLRTANELVKITQQRIDDRVNALGGLTIKLDPIKDHAIVAAMKRRFPDKIDPTQISYDDYRSVLGCVQDNTITPPEVSVDDIRNASQDPYRTDFGGINNQQGENRLEVSSTIQSIAPIDLEEYQKNAVLAVFKMMLPLLKNLLSPK
jgi:hypothetical protein